MLSRLLASLGSEPWMLEPMRAEALQRLAVTAAAGETIAPESVLAALGVRPRPVMVAAPGAAARESPPFDLVGSTAVVHIWGVLDKTDSDVADFFGRFGTSYESIVRSVAAAQADDRVERILLNIDSPGGAARPIEPFSRQLFAAAEAGRGGGKPLYAFANDLMASAALYLGVQADRVFTTPGGWVGSIGVITMAVDVTARLQQFGIQVHTIKSGEFKDLGNPFRAMTERDRAKIQAGVNDYFALFLGAVARGRRMDPAAVRALATGEGFIGHKAVEAGLVDGVRDTLAGLIAELNNQAAGGSGRGGRAAAIAHAPTGGLAHAPSGGQAGAAGGSQDMEENLQGQGSGPTAGAAGALAAAAGGTTPQTSASAQPGQAAPARPAQAPPAPPAQSAPPTSVQDQVAAGMRRENERMRGIETACRPYLHLDAVRTLRDEALLDTTATVETVAFRVLQAVQKASPPVGTLEVGEDGWTRERADMEHAVLCRIRPDLPDRLAGNSEAARRIARHLGSDDAAALGAALRRAQGAMARRRLIDMAERCAAVSDQRRGLRPRAFATHDDVLLAAFGHSSSDLPHLTSNVANKALLTYFAEVETTYQLWCAIGSSPDFKATDLITLSELPNLVLTPEGAPLKEATINERKEAIRVATYGRKFSITREMMTNDDLGGIQRTLQTWGIVGARTPEILATTALVANPTMADGKALFHTDHRNIGSGVALSTSALETAVAAMRKQRGFGTDQAFLDVRPRVLLTGVDLWGQANRVTMSVVDPTADNTNSAVPNVIRSLGLDPVNTPYISSATAWYLLGDPSLQPVMQVNFLQGRRTPIVTPVGDGSIRGQEFEVLFDVGVKAVGFEGGYFDAGAGE